MSQHCVIVMDEDRARAVRAGWMFAVGAMLLTVGDALYGVGYYERQIAHAATYYVSAALGLVAGALYVASADGIASLTYGTHRTVTSLGLRGFGLAVCAVHPFAGAIMLATNAKLSGVPLGTLETELDTAYALLAIPMFIGLVAGWGALAVAIVRGKSALPRSRRPPAEAPEMAIATKEVLQ